MIEIIDWGFVIFITVLVTMALFELWLPKRSLLQGRFQRWWVNFSLIIIGNALNFFILPIGLWGVAIYFVERQGFGILRYINFPSYINFIVGILLLDFAIWLQHIMSHKIPILWCLHKVHHSDIDVDVSTGVRFHPLEILLSLFYKILIVIFFGISPFTVLSFEIILASASLFNHSNIAISNNFERLLRFLVVTPDMHRIHHSVDSDERDSNFGFSLSLWDRLFSTYINSPKKGDKFLKLGLNVKPQIENKNFLLGLIKLIIMPWK